MLRFFAGISLAKASVEHPSHAFLALRLRMPQGHGFDM
jgi:hypothetical protein